MRPLYFMDVSFSHHIFSDAGKLTSTKLSNTMWLSPNRTFAIPVSSKYPLKSNGAKKTKFATFFVAMLTSQWRMSALQFYNVQT